VSKVFIPVNRELKKIAANLPYLLRGIAFEGKEKKIFAQEMDIKGNLTGEVCELTKKGDEFIVGNPLQLPLFGNLFSFNMFSDSKGKSYFIVYHPDGYLLVYSKAKKLLWKSSDKFGGFETSVNGADKLPLLVGTYPSPRIHVTRNGEVVVSRNSGLFTVGDTRSYSKNYVMKLAWNGSALHEKWRFEQSRNYLADLSYDDRFKELLLLELEQKNESEDHRGTKIVVKALE
jgi:hypothetical protein